MLKIITNQELPNGINEKQEVYWHTSVKVKMGNDVLKETDKGRRT